MVTTTKPVLSKAEGTEVYVLEPRRRYAAPSSRDDGTAYEVEIYPDGDFSCNRPGFQYRHTCRHSKAVLLQLPVKPQREWTSEDEAKLKDLY
jgi:hypothetical protein